MPRAIRNAPGGMLFHVMNRGVGKLPLFGQNQDYLAFESILEETLRFRPMRVCAYCLMPNHWHFLLWPEQDGQLPAFMQRLGTTHVQRWQRNRDRVGSGHLYQGRYRSFPVQNEDYFYQAARYVERNALRAKLTPHAENWRWSSLWRRVSGDRRQKFLLCDWPVPMPEDWCDYVNRPETEAELESLHQSIKTGRPFGDIGWIEQIARRLGLESTLRKRGRPRIKS
jgi:putative transposase